MAGWRELAKGNTLHSSAKETTGSRTFIWAPDGTETLPAIGDLWPTWNEDGLLFPLYVKDLDRTYADGDPEIPQWVVSYSNMPFPDPADSLDDLLKNADFSGEFLNIGKKTGAKWEDNTDIEQDMFKKVVTTTFKIPKVFMSFDDFVLKFLENAGCVNSTSFLRFPARAVMFSGAPVTEFKDNKGRRRWRAELTFDVRAPFISTGVYGTWDTLWNEKQGCWMDPQDYVYEEKDFATSLFAIPAL